MKMVMKKILLLIVAASLSMAAFAQDNGQRQGRERPDEATIIKLRTERMIKMLGLDETQGARLLELNKKYPNVGMRGPGGPGGPGMGRPPRNPEGQGAEGNTDAKVKKGKKDKKGDKGERPELTEEQKQKMEQARQESEAYEAELKKILTEEQFKTWQESRNRPPQGRGPGGPGRPGGFGGGED